MLQACADAGGVKRVIVSSSCAAISSGATGNPGNPPDYVYTEKDWSDEAACACYHKSKLKAEQSASDLVKILDHVKVAKRFKLAIVNPVYVQGSLISASCGEVS